jgi:ketosteroid isomerase-like protein
VPERAEIERIVLQAYEARRTGDLDTLTRIFSDRAQFRLAGTRSESPVAVTAAGAKQFKETLQELITVFEWLDQTILSMVIEAPKAAVHWRGTIRSSATGETVETELMDLFAVENGRIASLVEFCDTALAARLMGASPKA